MSSLFAFFASRSPRATAIPTSWISAFEAIISCSMDLMSPLSPSIFR
jgi:hypothetical protein